MFLTCSGACGSLRTADAKADASLCDGGAGEVVAAPAYAPGLAPPLEPRLVDVNSLVGRLVFHWGGGGRRSYLREFRLAYHSRIPTRIAHYILSLCAS